MTSIDPQTAQSRDTLVAAMARLVPAGALCVQGLSTPLATAALMLAKAVHSPDVVILYTDGGVVSSHVRPVSLTGSTRQAVEGAQRRITFEELITELVPTYQPMEFMRPAQLDATGSSNNVLIAREQGDITLPGSAGIGDATSVNGRLLYYLPRHDRRTLVERVDFRSGAGRLAGDDAALPSVPIGVVTELCTFRFEADGAAVLQERQRPVAEILARTGFSLEGTDDGVPTTAPPTEEERTALEWIDPHRIRDLEFLSAAERRERIRSLLRIEEEMAT